MLGSDLPDVPAGADRGRRGARPGRVPRGRADAARARWSGPPSPTARWSRRSASTTGMVQVGVFAAGSLLAATAGVLGGPIYGARPGLDATVLILALVVVVIGGLGSVRGALVGALLIGQVESLGRALLPDLALVPPVRRAGDRAGAAPARAVRQSAHRRARDDARCDARCGARRGGRGVRRAVPRGRRGLVAAAVLVVLAAAPFFLAPFATTTLTRILVFALLAASLDLLVGITGLPSLGHAAYFGAGAYAAGWVAINVTASAPVPLLVGAAVGAVAAALTGWVAVRSRRRLLPHAHARHRRDRPPARRELGERHRRLQRPVRHPGRPGRRARRCATPASVLLVRARRVRRSGFVARVAASARSPFGATLRGIRDNEPRMRALGYPTGAVQVRGLRARRRRRRPGRRAARRAATARHAGRPRVRAPSVARAAGGDHRRRGHAVGRRASARRW